MMYNLANPASRDALLPLRLLAVIALLLVTAEGSRGSTVAGAERKDKALTGARITVVGKSIGAQDVFRRISASAHVRVTASDHLLDRWLTVSANDAPVMEVLEGLRKLFDTPRYPCAIQRTKSGDWILWQDPRAALEFQRMLDAERRMILSAYLHTLSNGVPGQIRPEWSKDPLLRSLTRPADWRSGGRDLLQRLSETNSHERMALANGKTIWLSSSESARRPSELSRPGDPNGGGVRRDYGLSILVSDVGEQWRFFLRDRTRTTVNSVVRSTTKSLGVLIGPIGFSVPGADVVAVSLPGKSVKQLPAGQKWKEFADFQLDLARSTGVALVSDYYHDKPAPKAEQIQRIGENWPEIFRYTNKPAKYDLWKHRGMLVFRSHQWFYDVQFETPARLHTRLVQSDRKRGYLSFDELAEAGVMNDRQLKSLSTVLPVAGQLSSYRSLFRWYRGLPLVAQRRIVSGSECIVGATNYRALLNDEGQLDPNLRSFGPAETMRVTLATARTAGQLRYEFVIRNGKPRVQLPIEQDISFHRSTAPGS